MTIEMPKYKCHKEVWALKIKLIEMNVEEGDGSATIIPEEESYAPFMADKEYMLKHKPHIGGYYIVYKGGYKSFSPAIDFEEGYSLL